MLHWDRFIRKSKIIGASYYVPSFGVVIPNVADKSNLRCQFALVKRVINEEADPRRSCYSANHSIRIGDYQYPWNRLLVFQCSSAHAHCGGTGVALTQAINSAVPTKRFRLVSHPEDIRLLKPNPIL